MTIAACYLSPEGIVLGADSTSTYAFPGADHHFNYGQKLFEIGEKSTFGIVTWGLGGLGLGSYRTLIARLADDLKANPASSVAEVAARWIDLIWQPYSLTFAPQIQLGKVLGVKSPFVPGATSPTPGSRTQIEETQFLSIKTQLVAGFCISGYAEQDRNPAAFEVILDPLLSKPSPTPLPLAQSFWGMPALITRLIKGCADDVREAILRSGKWTGTEHDLDLLIQPHGLVHPPTMPIREAIDFTHACLLTTIKALKFSSQSRRCGGPIEIAVITTDRRFRWVQHKPWDAAIRESSNEPQLLISSTRP